MVNKVAKGSRNQLKTRKYLEKSGWMVYTVPRVMFLKNHDIFGLFDHVAFRDGKLRFVQTKTNSCAKSVKVAIREFQLSEDVLKEVFIWHDGNPNEPEIIRL